ncbi:MAG: type II secretion system protein [bacterium]|nr:type II secretion system protein [bacterium]
MRTRGRGFTLIEVIVALTILAMSILLITRAFLILIQVTNQGGNKTVASALAVRVLEEVRSRPESQSSSAGWTANFDAIAPQPLTNFGAPYSNYAFQVLVNQVDLSLPQPAWINDYSHPNALKWVTIKVEFRGQTLAQVSSAVVRDMYRRP